MTIGEFNALKLWQAAELALTDIELCEQAPAVLISMDDWMKYGGKNVVLYSDPSWVERQIGRRWTVYPVPEMAWAINELLQGLVSEALGTLGRPVAIEHDRDITDYRKDPDAFKREIRELIADLKAAGL